MRAKRLTITRNRSGCGMRLPDRVVRHPNHAFFPQGNLRATRLLILPRFRYRVPGGQAPAYCGPGCKEQAERHANGSLRMIRELPARLAALAFAATLMAGCGGGASPSAPKAGTATTVTSQS